MIGGARKLPQSSLHYCGSSSSRASVLPATYERCRVLRHLASPICLLYAVFLRPGDKNCFKTFLVDNHRYLSGRAVTWLTDNGSEFVGKNLDAFSSRVPNPPQVHRALQRTN
eukprot:646510-Pleurochrysis_carterae.AAC.1